MSIFKKILNPIKNYYYWIMSRKYSISFDEIADNYDNYRPSYPDELYQKIVNLWPSQPGPFLLEIGCGSGQATQKMAKQGFKIAAIEPSKKLSMIAARNLTAYPNLKINNTTFEKFEAKGYLFDGIYSAEAFHWVNKNIAYKKSYEILKPKGHLLLFWNFHPEQHDEISGEIRNIYSQFMPSFAGKLGQSYMDQLIEYYKNCIIESGYFKPPTLHTFAWSQEYDSDTYGGLLRTYSDYIVLSDSKKEQLLQEIKEIFVRNNNKFIKEYQTILFCTRKN